MIRHPDDKIEFFRCPHCGENFVSQSGLQLHLKDMHGREQGNAVVLADNAKVVQSTEIKQ